MRLDRPDQLKMPIHLQSGEANYHTSRLESKLTEVIDQSGLNVLTLGAVEVEVSGISPFAIDFFECPNLGG